MPSHRARILEVFALAKEPLSAPEAANLCGLTPDIGAALVFRLAHDHTLTRVNTARPARYALAHYERQELPFFERPPDPHFLILAPLLSHMTSTVVYAACLD